MTRALRTEHPVSAGGVVCREGEDGLDVVLCGRTSPAIWALPKGTPEPGETREQTAVREVTEETGLEVGADRLIDSIEYWFVRDGVCYHKTVHYYLMRATGGSTSRHDHEFDEVRWFAAQDAIKTMTYENEVRVVEQGLSLATKKGSSSRK